MKPTRFLTWLDIQRRIQKETSGGRFFPDPIQYIHCFSDAVEIRVNNLTFNKNKAESILSEWFKDWYDKNENLIYLDVANTPILVDFIESESGVDRPRTFVRPFWNEILYLNNTEEDSEQLTNLLEITDQSLNSPRLIAFYSFKGGVGRTVHLASYFYALLEAAHKNDQGISVLVVDADLEAPGLTYWDRLEKQQSSVSFINFLELYHYSPIDLEESFAFFAEEVKKSVRRDRKSTIYFLPACLSDEQLLDTPVLPEHLARSLENPWACSQALYRLGQILLVDYVIIDLRAGLSEISSPIIFDPRIERFFVSTITEQSISGLSFVLEQISSITNLAQKQKLSEIYDPSVTLSFLTDDLRKSERYENALLKLQTAYQPADSLDQDIEDNIYSKRLKIDDTYFSQDLLSLNTWEEAKSKIFPTSLMKVAKEWAELTVTRDFENKFSSDSDQISNNSENRNLDEVRKFKDACFIYAESGGSRSLLITESLKNLAKNYKNDFPRVVSIGAKGSGKTFTYIQLSRLQYWEEFLKLALKEDIKTEDKIYIFPLLQSHNLQDSGIPTVGSARQNVRSAFQDQIPEFLASNLSDNIHLFLREERDQLDWINFWIKQISDSVGLSDNSDLPKLNNYLKDKNVKLIFLFDGLEDTFKEASTNIKHQIALRSLISLPQRLNEIRNLNFGLIILLRRDFLRYSINQNLGQFENAYQAYDLSWDFDSFVKLVYWICSQAKVIDAKEIDIDEISQEDMINKLEKLWGKKLGNTNSKEAYTCRWIHAALTDFKGRLQARDIVLLLYNAANSILENPKGLQFDKWSSDRLLPPQAIRRSIKPCSENKVTEIAEEYPDFKNWREQVSNYTKEQKQIPFTLDTLDLEPSVLKMLEDLGVLYEDQDAKKDISRYYIPEIFREGLGFELSKGARPRVLVLKRKALGF